MLMKFSIFCILCICTVCSATKEFNDSSCTIKCKNSNNVVTFIKDQRCLPLFGNPIDIAVEYNVKLVGTWNDETHTFHRRPNHWSPMSGISHTAAYEVWENCFKNVTRGVKDVSERGSAAQVESEYIVNKQYILDSFRGNVIGGDGTNERTLRVNKWFHYITVISMMGNTPDYMLGVDRLDLITDNRRNWRKSVKVCATLYASGTKTKPVRCPNSIQYENCSFAYFQFTLKQPSLICQQNEVLTLKPLMCDPNCESNGRRPFNCRVKRKETRCVCAKGYARNKVYECVSKNDCSTQYDANKECKMSEWEPFAIKHSTNGDTEISEMRYMTQPPVGSYQDCNKQEPFRVESCESSECKDKVTMIDRGCAVWINPCSLIVQCGTTEEYDETINGIKYVMSKKGNSKSWFQLEKNGLKTELNFETKCINADDACIWESPK